MNEELEKECEELANVCEELQRALKDRRELTTRLEKYSDKLRALLLVASRHVPEDLQDLITEVCNAEYSEVFESTCYAGGLRKRVRVLEAGTLPKGRPV